MTEPEEDPGVVWMRAVQEGDTDAFEQLVSAYERPIFAMLRRMLGPSAPVEDLAQEAFLRVWRSRERYRPEGRFLTWLYRITWNLAVNHVRGQRRKPLPPMPRDAEGVVMEPLDAAGPPPEAGADSRDWVRLLDGALERLPENQRAALVFQHYDGMDLTEIGDVLGISPKAAKSLLHRARENLRTLLEPYREAEHD